MSAILVVIVCPIVLRHDAISASARQTYLALAADSRFETTLLTWSNDFADVRSEHAGTVSEMLLNPVFLNADVIIYHFGVYAGLFDAMLVGNGRAKQAVKFHNVTPVELISPDQRSTAKASLRQVQNLRHVDEVWSDSETNARELARQGFDSDRLLTVPLAVETPALARLSDKPAGPIVICFVGRIVPSKGVVDLLRALQLMDVANDVALQIKIAGNRLFSDPSYVARVEDAARSSRFPVELLGTIDDDALAELYRTSHIFVIPSYHEGFCKPVVEAMRAGCVPVGYAAHNLPDVVGGLGRLVPTGDVPALARALESIVDAVSRGCVSKSATSVLPLDGGPMSIEDFDSTAKRHVAHFSFEKYAATICERTAALASSVVS